MDVNTLASVAISILIPFLKNLAEGMSKKVGEEIGSKSASKLFEKIKDKFSSNPKAQKALLALKKEPDDHELQATVQNILQDYLEKDKSFAKKIEIGVSEKTDIIVENILQTTVKGNVDKIVNVGNVQGDLHIE